MLQQVLHCVGKSFSHSLMLLNITRLWDVHSASYIMMTFAFGFSLTSLWPHPLNGGFPHFPEWRVSRGEGSLHRVWRWIIFSPILYKLGKQNDEMCNILL